MTGAALRLRGIVVVSADQVRAARERDKLTIAEVCADLGVSRRTFYEWRARWRPDSGVNRRAWFPVS